VAARFQFPLSASAHHVSATTSSTAVSAPRVAGVSRVSCYRAGSYRVTCSILRSPVRLPPKPPLSAVCHVRVVAASQQHPARWLSSDRSHATHGPSESLVQGLAPRSETRGRAQQPPSPGLLPILLISQKPTNDGPAPALPQDPDHPPTAQDGGLPRRVSSALFDSGPVPSEHTSRS
jgi:hypothetical protein